MIPKAQEAAPRLSVWRMAAAALAVVVLLIALLVPAYAAERVALVIGNSQYLTAGNLKNPRNDAEAVSAALTRLGFHVIKGTDTNLQELRGLVRDFAKELESARVALFFYAGHALQLNGNNYLVPVDAKFESESDVDFETVDLNFVLRQMERKDGTAIVLLDACRNNPLSQKLAQKMGQRAVYVGRGLARVETGVGTFIGFATQPDNVAYDGGAGDNSPFTSALLKHIETPGLDIEVMMRRVREEVMSLTGGKQVPWSNSSLIGDRVVLKMAGTAEEPAPSKPALVITPVTPAVQDPADVAARERDIEIAYWNSVKDSGSAALLRAYLSTYPQGSFADLAVAMIEELETGRAISVEPAPLPREKPVANFAPDALLDETSPEPPSVVEPEETEPAPVIDKKESRREKPAAKPKKTTKPAAKAKKPAPQKAVAPKQEAPKKVTRKPAPRKEAISTPQGKDCDYCYGCMSDSRICRRTWVCGARYRERLADGLCVWRR